MKQFLLLFCTTLLLNVGLVQSSMAQDWMSPFNDQTPKEQIQVFPNPAVSHIGLTSAKGVEKVVVYNLVGNKLKEFTDISEDKKFYIGDLTKGFYLVQIMDRQNKIITTRRISKK